MLKFFECKLPQYKGTLVGRLKKKIVEKLFQYIAIHWKILKEKKKIKKKERKN